MNWLITGAWQNAAQHIGALQDSGHAIAYMPREQDALPVAYEWVEGIVGNGIFLSHPIERFTRLRAVQLTSAGYDRVPMDYVRAHGIEIRNARGVYSGPMAEYAVAGVLALYKRLRYFEDNQKQHRWEKRRDLWELAGKTVCIVGCGSVGDACAKRFAAFDCRVLGVDIRPRQAACYEDMLSCDGWESLLPTADVVVLTLPLTEDTRHMMDRGRLGLLKDTAVVVNIARGGIIDTEALIEALPRIGGAVLDVVEEEPLGADSPLWDMENVLLTPHSSFIGDHIQQRLDEVIVSYFREMQG